MASQDRLSQRPTNRQRPKRDPSTAARTRLSRRGSLACHETFRTVTDVAMSWCLRSAMRLVSQRQAVLSKQCSNPGGQILIDLRNWLTRTESCR